MYTNIDYTGVYTIKHVKPYSNGEYPKESIWLLSKKISKGKLWYEASSTDRKKKYFDYTASTVDNLVNSGEWKRIHICLNI